MALLCAFTTGAAQAQATAPAKPAAPTGFLPPASASANVIDSIAVVVNDEVITRNELAGRVRDIEMRMRANNSPMPDREDLERQVTERMIVERAQLQLAREYGVRISDMELDRAVARIAEGQKMSVQDLRNAMEKEGMPFPVFREEIRKEIILTRLREHEVDAKVQVSDAEVDTFIAAQEAAAAQNFELNLAQILVRIPDNASPEQIAARKARADEVMRQLRTGADFARVAATFSDASDALQGGAVGWRPSNSLPPVFADVLVRMNPGQVTDPIRSSTGFHILKLVDKREPPKQEEAPVVQQTRARHILIKLTPTMSEADAQKKLTELKAQVDSKAATFEELARQNSNDTSAAKGGDLGWLYPGDTMPEFENVMNSLKPGEVSGIVKTPLGLHLIQVVERKADDAAKERKRQEARQALFARKQQEALEDWERQVRDRAYVEFREQDL
ncbi:MAG TPA: peptidylprolyl isomerase [Telluria sp.]